MPSYLFLEIANTGFYAVVPLDFFKISPTLRREILFTIFSVTATCANISWVQLLSGFIIEQGNADQGVNALQEQKSGGGLFNAHTSSSAISSPTLSHLIFRDNYALEQGGGIYSDGNATINISNSEFINNCLLYTSPSPRD